MATDLEALQKYRASTPQAQMQNIREGLGHVLTSAYQELATYTNHLNQAIAAQAHPNAAGKYYVPYLGQYLTKEELNVIIKNNSANKAAASKKVSALQKQIADAKKNIYKKTGTGTGGSSASTKTVTSFSKTVLYNCNSAAESYFRTTQSFFNEPGLNGEGKQRDAKIYQNNTPQAVTDATKLWTKGLSSKGMIQTWTPPGGNSGFLSDGGWTTLSAGKSVQRYGFQFLYNPSTISMNYGGVSDVDPSMMTSGKEEYLLSNPSVFKSTIDIDVMINRMHDIKHLGPGGVITDGLKASEIWTGNVPKNDKAHGNELKKIYEYGTMYDVEFLLKAMLRYEIKSQLRKDSTADLGFLGASPVEFHLGNKLRYVCQINNIQVEHKLFDDRMVPIFTMISISANRIPDYAGATVKNGGK